MKPRMKLMIAADEIFANIVKYSGATDWTLKVEHERYPDTVRLVFTDDGKPFDPASAPGPSEGHFGVEGMRQRARRIGATISFAERGGWMVMEVTK